MRARAAVLVAIACCGDSPAHTQIVNTTPGACGHPGGDSTISIIAYTPAGEVTRTVDAATGGDLGDLPADTLQLGVQVLDATSAVLVEGKSAPLPFASLADGTQIPIFVAPENGLCATGALTAARAQPLMARAGDGVLVVGGTDGSGAPLATAEYYDPLTATFSPVEVPDALTQDPSNGLAGGVLTALPGGKVVLTGTSRGILAVFDPADTTMRTFEPPATIDPRAFHAATAVDDHHVLIAGGCNTVAAATLAPSALALQRTLDYTLDDDSHTGGPSLANTAKRFGASVLYDVGDGFVLAGGFGDPGAADRFQLGDIATTPIAGLTGSIAPLDGGALLATDATGMRVLPAGGVAPVTIAATTVDATIATLEDGTIVAFGSDVERYDPTQNQQWQVLPVSPGVPSLAGAVALTLADGSVLVQLGAQAWVFRPSLVGPTSGSAIAVPLGGGSGVLTATDPATLDLTTYELTAPDDSLDARVLVGGPRPTTGLVRAQVIVRGGGVALIAQQVAPDHAVVARLVPGAAATLERLGSGVACTGQMIAFDTEAITLQLALDADGTATLSRDDVAILHCAFDPGHDVGAWGLAALGSGAQVDIQTVTVGR